MDRLHYYVEHAQHEKVREMIAAGSDVNSERENLTPLERAIHNNDLEMVEILIGAGADVNHSHPKSGKRPLHCAVTQDLRIIDLLLDAGADVEGGKKTGTPLCIAAAFRKREAYNRLIVAGADPTATLHGVEAQVEIEMPCPFEIASEVARKAEEESLRLDADAQVIQNMMNEYASAEEYAAHRGRGTYVFSLHLSNYSDPAVADWAKRYAEIIFSRELLTKCEEDHLSGDELESARKERRSLDRWRKRQQAKKDRLEASRQSLEPRVE